MWRYNIFCLGVNRTKLERVGEKCRCGLHSYYNCGPRLLAQLLLLLSFVLEHDETSSEPCVALM